MPAAAALIYGLFSFRSKTEPLQTLTTWDLILAPIFLALLIVLAKSIRDKRYPKGHPLRKYYMPALYVKFGGAIFIALIYEFYYGGGGDSFNFFKHSQTINSSLDHSVATWWQLILRKPAENDPVLYEYAGQMEWYVDPASYTVARLGAFIGLLCGTTYIPIALIFAYIAFTGIWAMYVTFVNVYPRLYKQLAIAFLFIPSVIVWGSAMYKDTLCMFGLGWMTYTTFRLFINKDFSARNIFLLVFSFYLIAVVKLYILLAFLPALSLWLLLSYSHKIKSSGIRFVVRLAFIGVTVGGFFFFTEVFSAELNRYSLDKISETSAITRQWINYSSGDEGSAYDLGNFDASPLGMLSKLPAAVVVTLFRPFPWEAKKVIIALSMLEAFLFLCGTIFVFYKIGFGNFFKKIFQDPNLTFFFTFSVIFAFAVGISSYNFGALSRYKIPCLSFYSGMLYILYYNHKLKKQAEKKQFKDFKSLKAA